MKTATIDDFTFRLNGGALLIYRNGIDPEGNYKTTFIVEIPLGVVEKMIRYFRLSGE